jgi:hypothetical protein
MACFAKVKSNGIVVQVESVDNSILLDENGVEQEQLGIDFLRKLYNEPNGNWKQGSYGTYNGEHYTFDENNDMHLSADQSKAFRIHHPGINYIWDETLQGFLPPKPYPSWVLHTGEKTATRLRYEWYPPIPDPNIIGTGDPDTPEHVPYNASWDEENQRWTAYLGTNTDTLYIWNQETSSWDAQ